jgi:hypothetical protein
LGEKQKRVESRNKGEKDSGEKEVTKDKRRATRRKQQDKA